MDAYQQLAIYFIVVFGLGFLIYVIQEWMKRKKMGGFGKTEAELKLIRAKGIRRFKALFVAGMLLGLVGGCISNVWLSAAGVFICLFAIIVILIAKYGKPSGRDALE